MKCFPSAPLSNLGEKGEVVCPEGPSLLFSLRFHNTKVKQEERRGTLSVEIMETKSLRMQSLEASKGEVTCPAP